MSECVEGGREGVKGEPAGGRKEGSEAFIEEGGKWPCRSLRKEEGRESSDVTAKEGLLWIHSLPPPPRVRQCSELGRPAIRPLAGPPTV